MARLPPGRAIFYIIGDLTQKMLLIFVHFLYLTFPDIFNIIKLQKKEKRYFQK